MFSVDEAAQVLYEAVCRKYGAQPRERVTVRDTDEIMFTVDDERRRRFMRVDIDLMDDEEVPE